MRRKSIDEQLIEMEREDRERLAKSRIRLSLTELLVKVTETYGAGHPITVAVHTAWRLSVGMPG